MSVGKILLALVAVWVAFAVIGSIVKGLFFLFVIGLVLLGGTLAVGAAKRNGVMRR